MHSSQAVCSGDWGWEAVSAWVFIAISVPHLSCTAVSNFRLLSPSRRLTTYGVTMPPLLCVEEDTATCFVPLPFIRGEVNSRPVSMCVLRHFADWGPLRIWAGAGVGDMFDIRYNPLLANACVGMSNFAVLSLSTRAEVSVQRWMFYGQMSVLPVALMLRPGFSYLNNYDREIANPLSAAFDQYRTYLTALPGVSTRVGVVRWLKSGNGIALSYDWHYLTSRVSGRENVAPWRMQQASHGLTLQLLFSL